MKVTWGKLDYREVKRTQRCVFDLYELWKWMPTAWACVPWTKGPKWAKLSFSSVFHSGFEHEYPATHCDQGRDPWPCSLHRRNVCAHYWLHRHHRKPPSPLRVLQVQKFLLWLIWVALSFTCAFLQLSALLSSWIKSNGSKCGGERGERATLHTQTHIHVHYWQPQHEFLTF